MKVIETSLPGVLIIEPRVLGDHRGFFLETYHHERYAAHGIPDVFVQDNHARSLPGTLRGLHYQINQPQGKLVRCVRGAIWDVAVDIRVGSATFGKWKAVELTDDNKRQFYIPPGFAHGYCVPEVESEVEYKCTAYYDPADDRGVLWNDPALGIAWPVREPLLSEKDRNWAPLTSAREDLPRFR